MPQAQKDVSALAYIQKTASNFLDRQTSGGLLLIAATILALMLGNSQWAEEYHHLLEDEFQISLSGSFVFGLSIEAWINDGLMAIFFLVAGLELKREVLVGDLSTWREASMPILGALGGMLVPALLFILLNFGTDSGDGWGIPMATDIAYSLGIVGLLGKRIPAQLKVLLIALAIADDLGAILMIAIFYSKSISWMYLGSAAAVFVGLMFMNISGVKRLAFYVLGGVVMWYLFLNSGIHPTIAGVLFAFAIPVTPELDSRKLKQLTEANLKKLEEAKLDKEDPLQNKKQRRILRAIKRDTNRSRPPLLRLENALVNFNAFFIIPIFALANAGVELNVSLSEVFTDSLGLGIILGLCLGKVLGIGLFSYAGFKSGIADLHASISWLHLIGIGLIAGIGFTMSLFITNLAFADATLVKVSKISILVASLIAIVSGVTVLLLASKKGSKSSE